MKETKMKAITTANIPTVGKTSKYSSVRPAAATCAAFAVDGRDEEFSISNAQAYACRRSAVGAGCIGRHGAVGFNKHGAVVVRHGTVYSYHRGSKCYWRNNQRICP